MRPFVSVIVSHHRQSHLLKGCLASIGSHTSPGYELIVVANNADTNQLISDDSVQSGRIIRIGKNLGNGPALNIGAEHARGQYLVFLDEDMVATAGWLDALLELYCKTADCGAVSSKLVNPRTNRIVDFGIGHTPCNWPHHYLDRRVTDPVTMQPRIVQAACGAGLLVAYDDFVRLGGFRKEFANLYGDLDFCLRLKDLGKQVWACPGSILLHVGTEYSDMAKPEKSLLHKADLKGQFMMENAARIVVDMDRFLHRELNQVFKVTGRENKYLGIQMMSVANPDWFTNMVAEFCSIGNTYEYPSHTRDAETIDVYAHLGHDLVSTKIPHVLMVDRFISVRENVAWWTARNGIRDIVVDRHGNAASALALSSL